MDHTLNHDIPIWFAPSVFFLNMIIGDNRVDEPLHLRVRSCPCVAIPQTLNLKYHVTVVVLALSALKNRHKAVLYYPYITRRVQHRRTPTSLRHQQSSDCFLGHEQSCFRAVVSQRETGCFSFRIEWLSVRIPGMSTYD